jgi:protein-disulfide isomerase
MGLKSTKTRSGRVLSAQRRRFPIWVIVVIVLGVLVAGGLLFYLLIPLDAPIPDGVKARYVGLERGYTDEGFPRLGKPNAPILVEDFSSYSCPHCRHFHEKQLLDLLDEIAAGEIQFVFIPVPHIGTGAENAAKGALCAGEQGQFWEMSDALFHWQDKFVIRVFDEKRIQNGAKNLGLDTGAFKTCMDDNHPTDVLERAKDEFHQRDLSGTPSFFIDGERVSLSAVEDLNTNE